jgi:tetratricopeptide (TPR) repeat protein
MTSMLTLHSLAPGHAVLATSVRREFRIHAHLDGIGEGSSRLAEVFGELTRGLVLEHRSLSAEYRITGRKSMTLRVLDEETNEACTKSVRRDFTKGIEDIHHLYAEAVRLGVQMAPDEPYLVRALSDHFLAFRKYSSGIACFKQLIEMTPDHALLLFQLGILYDRSGRKREAYAAFRTVHRLNPQDAITMYNLGVIAADLGHLHEAESWFLEALARNPEMGPACTRLNLIRQRREGPRFRLKA